MNWNTTYETTTVARNKIDMMILAAALDLPCANRFTAACEGEMNGRQEKQKWICRSPPRSRNFCLLLLLLLFYTHTDRHTILVHKATSQMCLHEATMCRGTETGELLALLRPNCYDYNYEWTLLSRCDSEQCWCSYYGEKSETLTQTHRVNAWGNCFYLFYFDKWSIQWCIDRTDFGNTITSTSNRSQ